MSRYGAPAARPPARPTPSRLERITRLTTGGQRGFRVLAEAAKQRGEPMRARLPVERQYLTRKVRRRLDRTSRT